MRSLRCWCKLPTRGLPVLLFKWESVYTGSQFTSSRVSTIIYFFNYVIFYFIDTIKVCNRVGNRSVLSREGSRGKGKINPPPQKKEFLSPALVLILHIIHKISALELISKDPSYYLSDWVNRTNDFIHTSLITFFWGKEKSGLSLVVD